MQKVMRIWFHKRAKLFSWQAFALDSLLACVGSGLVTALVVLLQLYPRIPNISIVYLLVVLALASTRGRYASILASVVAFLTFDFFLVPPLHVFTIARVDEWIALFVFLVTALLTSQLAVALRERMEQAKRRERETHMLYDLVRLANKETEPGRQLSAVANSIVDTLAIMGVQNCAIMQPDASGGIQLKASSFAPGEQLKLSTDEQACLNWVMLRGRAVKFYRNALSSGSASTIRQRITLGSRTYGERPGDPLLRFLPLKIGQKIIGVLLLQIQSSLAAADLFPLELLEEEETERVPFFQTFLDQVATLVERARLQQENMRIAILQRTDKLRTALLSSVSHDLRTPLTSIKAAASSLLQEDVQWDEETRRGFARAIEQEVDRLNRLVGNLLDMSRIEDGALKPERETYALTALIHDVLDRLGPLLKGRVVRLHLPKDLLLVEVDELHMDQVITNLIENAVRYTPSSSPIDISARVVGSEVVMEVQDHGPGVPQEELTRIFDKFYRVLNDRRPGGNPSGSGLGLAVCKGLVEANGGRIYAELPSEGGLRMSVVLPHVCDEQEHCAKEEISRCK